MKLYIKNNVWSLRGSSSVKDENGKDVLVVKGKLISPTRVKRIRDLNGDLLYKVRNKWINWFSHSAFIYDSDHNKIAKVTRKFGLRNRIIVEGYKDEIAIEGEFLSWTLDIYRNGKHVGAIRRQFNLFDSFELEVGDEEDGAFLAAVVIAIDNIFDNKSNSRS